MKCKGENFTGFERERGRLDKVECIYLYPTDRGDH